MGEKNYRIIKTIFLNFYSYNSKQLDHEYAYIIHSIVMV